MRTAVSSCRAIRSTEAGSALGGVETHRNEDEVGKKMEAVAAEGLALGRSELVYYGTEMWVSRY